MEAMPPGPQNKQKQHSQRVLPIRAIVCAGSAYLLAAGSSRLCWSNARDSAASSQARVQRHRLPHKGRRTPRVWSLKNSLQGSAPNVPKWFSELQDIGLEADVGTYSSFIETACDGDNLEEAERWAKQATADGRNLDLETVEMLFQCAVRTSDFDAAQNWFAQAVSNGDPLSTNAAATCDMLLEKSMKLNDHRVVEWLLEDAVKAGYTPSFSASFNRLLTALAKSNRYDSQALQSFKLTRLALEAGLEMNTATLNGIIRHVAKTIDLNAAEQWFALAEDGQVEPNVYTFTELINAAAKYNDLASAERWFEKAIQIGITPDIVTFNTLINAAAKAGDTRAAERWFDKACEAKVDPDLVTFSSLIDAASQRGELSTAERWFEQASEFGITFDIRIYNVMIAAAAKQGNLAAAERWFDKAGKAKMKTDVVSYNSLMNAAMKAARPDLVEELLRRMLDNDIVPTEVTLGTIRWAVGRGRLVELLSEAGLSVAQITGGEVQSVRNLGRPRGGSAAGPANTTNLPPAALA